MTREELIKAFTMKVDGYSCQKISEELGVSKQCVHQAMMQIIKASASKTRENTVYPNLSYEILIRYRKMSDFCKDTHVEINHFRRVLRGETNPTYDDITKCCQVLKKEFEYLFEKKVTNNG